MRHVVVAIGVVIGAHDAAADVPFPNLPKSVAVRDVTATSTYADKHDAYAAWRALAYEVRSDMDMPEPVLWSAWCEGKKDEGIGEAVTVSLAEPTRIDRVRIAAGVWRTDKLFAANNHITSLEVIADGKAQTVKPAGKTWAEAKIGAKVSTLVFKIGAVKKGKMNDSCISGIDLVTGDDALVPAIGIDAKALAALPKAIVDIQAALGAPDRKGLEALIEFPFSNHDASGFFMTGPPPGKVASWKALLAACKTWEKASAKAEDWVDPKGCPEPANYDPTDDRTDRLRTIAPSTIVVAFPSHREVLTSWQLHWKDRWLLQAIDYE